MGGGGCSAASMRTALPPLVLLIVSGISSTAQPLRAGAAQVRITPEKPVPLAGYFRLRLSTAVHDDLWCKALVLAEEERRAALAACDLLEVPGGVVQEARRRIELETGIPPAAVMISATDTHLAPVVEGEFAAGLPAKIAEVVRLAAAAAGPARIAWAEGHEPSLVFHRRFFMKDGTVRFNPGKGNPGIVRPVGPVDPRVSVVAVDAADGRPVATLVNYALHLDTVGGTEVSADYPYTLSRLVGCARGGGVTIFTLGCAGNINHIDVSDARPQNGHGEAARIGTVLAGEVLKALARAAPVERTALRTASARIALPLVKHDAQDLSWSRDVLERERKGEKIAFLDLVKAYRIAEVEALGKPEREAEVQVIALGGDLAWAGLPGEIFVELGLALRRASPFRHTVAVSLANGSLGYFPDRPAWDHGHYEVITARCGRGSGERLVEAALRLLDEVKGK